MLLGGDEKGLEQLGEAAIERKRQGDRIGTSMNRASVYGCFQKYGYPKMDGL